MTGALRAQPVDLADGFIHMSTAAQLDETLRKHFAGMEDLQIAAIDLAALGGLVRWEPSRGGALFPHLYGELPLARWSRTARWCGGRMAPRGFQVEKLSKEALLFVNKK